MVIHVYNYQNYSMLEASPLERYPLHQWRFLNFYMQNYKACALL